MFLVVFLSLLLVAGVTTLVILISKTKGAEVQPPDVIPYVDTPGDLTDRLFDSRWENGS